jgi:hypothetical protein
MDSYNFEDLYWERLKGYVTENRVDGRWILKNEKTNKPFGSLRIVDHPDLRPGYLRAIFTYVTSIKIRNEQEKIMAVVDYQMSVSEMEVYSVDNDVKTETKNYEATPKELEELFNVKIF